MRKKLKYRIPRSLPPETPQNWTVLSNRIKIFIVFKSPSCSKSLFSENLNDPLVQCSFLTCKGTEVQRNEVIAPGNPASTSGGAKPRPMASPKLLQALRNQCQSLQQTRKALYFSFWALSLIFLVIRWHVQICNNSQTLGFLSVSVLEGVGLENFQPQRS